MSKSGHELIHIRRTINLMKNLAAIIMMLSFFVYYAVFNGKLETALYATSLTGIICYSLAALFDIHTESLDIPAAFVLLFSILAIMGGAMELLVLYLSGLSLALYATIIAVFLLMILFLSGNDMEMEGFASGYFYQKEDPRKGRFIAHLIFNLVPLWLAMVGLKNGYLQYGIRGAAIWATLFSSLLVIFSFTDEALRNKFHWSFFWHNQRDNQQSPEGSRLTAG